MRAIADEVAQFTDDDINKIETENEYLLNIGSETITLQLADVEISSEDIPWMDRCFFKRNNCRLIISILPMNLQRKDWQESL